MVESIREKKIKEAIRLKGRPTKWYFLRIAFWSMVIAYGFIMFLTGWFMGRYL